MDEEDDSVDEKNMTTLAGQKSGPTSVEGNTPPGGRVFEPWRLLVSLIAILAVMSWAFSDFFRVEIYIATSQPSDWGHVFVVPLIAFWFVWLRRDDLLAKPMQPTWVGLVFVLIGILIYMTGRMGPKQLIHHLVRSAGVFTTVFGLIVTLLGWRSFKVLQFPFFYLCAFGTVISDRIMTPVTYQLQDISAKGAWVVLKLMGFDTDLSGNTLTLFENGQTFPLNVAEACSGMRMLVAFLALGTAMAYVGLSRTWQRTLLIILGVPVAIFVNVLRVVTLGLLSRYDSNFAAGDFHTFIGLVWLIPAFLVFIFLMWSVRRLVIEPPLEVPAGSEESSLKLRFLPSPLPLVAVLVGIFACTAVAESYMMRAMNGYLAKKPVPLRASLDTIPKTLGAWKQVGEEREYDAAVIESLGTTQFIDRVYAIDGDPEEGALMLHIAYYSGTIDEIPHIPERCWDAAGLDQMGASTRLPLELSGLDSTSTDKINLGSGQNYSSINVTHPVTGVDQTVLLPVGDLELMTSVFATNQQPDARRVAGYLFVANGRSCSSSYDVRALAFDWTQEYAYYCKVQLSASYMVSQDGDEFMSTYTTDANDLLENLMPYLMRSLPDWSEIEQGVGLIAASSKD